MRQRTLVIDDGRTKREVPLVGTLTVGRDPSCQISDPDPLLSRRHAEFVSHTQHVTIRDLGSRNGVLVNGTKVPERILSPGDRVQLGHLHCVYLETTAAADVRSTPRPATIEMADALTKAPPPVERSMPERYLDDTKPSLPNLGSLSFEADVELTRLSTAIVTAPPLSALGSDEATAPLEVIDEQRTRDAAFDDETRAPGGTRLTPSAVNGSPIDPASDETMAPVGGRVAISAVDADETVAPSGRPTAADRREAPPARSRIVAGADLVVREVTGSPLGTFGLADLPVGTSLQDFVASALRLMSAGSADSSLSFVVERSGRDRSLTMTLTAGETIEK